LRFGWEEKKGGRRRKRRGEEEGGGEGEEEGEGGERKKKEEKGGRKAKSHPFSCIPVIASVYGILVRSFLWLISLSVGLS
jgi:hypothetical protein